MSQSWIAFLFGSLHQSYNNINELFNGISIQAITGLSARTNKPDDPASKILEANSMQQSLALTLEIKGDYLFYLEIACPHVAKRNKKTEKRRWLFVQVDVACFESLQPLQNTAQGF